MLEGDRVEISCSDLARGSGVRSVEVGDGLWGICDEGSGFPRVVAGVVALPPNLVLEFAAEEAAVQNVINFVLWFTLN